MKEEIEKRRAEAAERKKQMEVEESAKPAFAINPKGSSKVSVLVVSCSEGSFCWILPTKVCSVFKYPSCSCSPDPMKIRCVRVWNCFHMSFAVDS